MARLLSTAVCMPWAEWQLARVRHGVRQLQHLSRMVLISGTNAQKIAHTLQCSN